MSKDRTTLKDLTEAQYQKYFEVRFGSLRRSGKSYMTRCIIPPHQDDKPSVSVRFDKGVWHCHGCGKGGGLIDLEMYLGGDAQTAVARIADIVGLPQLKLGAGPEAIYQYRDAQGVPIFQVVRFPGKKFMQRKRLEDGSWDYKTSDLKMTLYNLPEVIQAKEVLVVEGEKDADRLMTVLEAAELRPGIAATTSPRGAGKWQDTFAPYFIGKKVVQIDDKDDPGRKHGQRVCDSVFPYAYGVKRIEVSVGKDVSEYFDSGKTINDLAAEIKAAVQWRPADAGGILAEYEQFEMTAPEQIDWMIEGMAERGSNGMLIARPKGGKSFVITDLAIALASGQKWLDFYVPRRVRVGLFSREDNPATTGHRLRKVREGRNLKFSDLNGWMFINTRKQSKTFMLDNEEEVAEAIGALLKHRIEVAIFDVMRVLHNEDENSNTDMQKVINVLNRIRDATGATIILVHHSRKGEDEASLTEMARGAGAIAGWCEWIAGISVVDKEQWIRSMEIELKGAESPKKFYWKIHDITNAGNTYVEVRREENYQPVKRRRSRDKEVEDDAPKEPTPPRDSAVEFTPEDY